MTASEGKTLVRGDSSVIPLLSEEKSSRNRITLKVIYLQIKNPILLEILKIKNFLEFKNHIFKFMKTLYHL
jgi:hypothetical protein